MARQRLRDLDIVVGTMPTGPLNAITDVPGIWVGHTTLNYDRPRIARTGVTVIVPREDKIRQDYCYAGYHSFNGNGEMTGLLWLEESGMLGSPIAITNTHQVGVVRDALVAYAIDEHDGRGFFLPVVAETYDGYLNDIAAFHVTKEHVFEALRNAGPGPVAEGNVGGGTGMICHEFKGGIGTSSRLAACPCGEFTVGALVQANYGRRNHLRVNGFPVGNVFDAEKVPLPAEKRETDGSIIVVIATDAPLLPFQCKRLAQRATVGLSRVGGIGHNSSGDIFIAFATGNHLPAQATEATPVQMIPNNQMDAFFEATAEAVEESILNAMAAAETMTGFKGRTVHAMPQEELRKLMAKW